MPAEVAEDACIPGPRPARVREWAALGRTFGFALAEYPPEEAEWARLGAAGMLAYAATNLRYRETQERNARECPHIRVLPDVLAEARASGVSWRWHDRGPARHDAILEAGRLVFLVSFFRRGATWHQGWSGLGQTATLIDHLEREARLGRPVRTGLFPALDAAIGQTIRDFIEAVGPDDLRVDGVDARRNAHNLRTYAAHAPEGYALEPIRDPGTLRATADDVTGVRFVRLPEPDPGLRP